MSTRDPLYDNAILDRPGDAFIKDAQAGTLPQVSWIVAPEAQSEHPSYPPAIGADLTSRCIAAVMNNQKVWAKTVFILSYDENGGYFDHVPPPVPPPGTAEEFISEQPIGLGFRVPTVVVSPWSRGGRVDHGVYDHTSTLLLIEKRFGVEVPNLSAWRRQTCGDLTATLDFDRPDIGVAKLPDTAALAAAAKNCATLPDASPPSPQRVPTTEN